MIQKPIRFLALGAVFLLLCIAGAMAQQQTVTITTGPNWADAVISRSAQPGYTHVANTNYGSDPRISANAWTGSGNPTFRRTLLRFDLQQIPIGSTVHSAVFYLYSDPTSTGLWDQNSQLSGSNSFFLERVMPWNETTVTWNNQPNSSATGRIWVGASTSTFENRQITITG